MNARGYLLALGGLLLAGCASTPEQPGEGPRTLSPLEAEGLLQGRGMGMAAVAEINGYPGPMHVLELKEELGLTPDQRFATSRLLGLTQGQVRALGQRIVEAEQQLDADLAAGSLNRDQVRARIQAIAALRGELRYVHVDAHLQQKKLLTPEQVQRYYELRGRKVVVPAPAAPPPVREALRLQAPEPASEPQAVTPPAIPAASPDLPPDVSLPAASAPTVTDDTAPVLPPSAEPPAQPQTMTPGMRDAIDDSETRLPHLPDEETMRTDPETAAPPAIDTGRENGEETPPPLPAAVEPAPSESGSSKTAVTEKSRRSPRSLTPGMRDAMEFAEPAPEEEEAVRIAPLDQGEEEPPLPPPSGEIEPAAITLDN